MAPCVTAALSLGVILVLFAVSVWAGGFLGAELIPQFAQGEFSFSVELPEGSPLYATDAKLTDMEEIVSDYDDVERYFASVGIASRFGQQRENQRQEYRAAQHRSEGKGRPGGGGADD